MLVVVMFAFMTSMFLCDIYRKFMTLIAVQVEAYVKEHLKPLYKSGVIKSDQFRFAVAKTASKVMQHHGHATSADFLIVEGSKVKKLADQYLQTFVHKK